MVNNPIISLIIPVYNASQYIKKCIESIESQGIDSKDFEIICVDDCSTDNSSDIILSLANCYSNIRLIKHAQNKQQGAARNTGLLEALGRYIWFIDADDYIASSFLDHIYDKKLQNEEVDIFQFNSISVNMDGTQFHEEYLDHEYCSSGIDYLLFESRSGYKNRIKATWSKWFRRRFLIENNLFFKEHVYWEDVAHTLLCFIKAKQIWYLPVYGYMYLQTPGSDMRGKQNGRKYADSIGFCIDCMEIFDKENTHSDIVNFMLPTLEKTLYKYKKNLHKLPYKEFRIFSKKIQSMDVDIIDRYVSHHDHRWLRSWFYHFLVWMRFVQ